MTRWIDMLVRPAAVLALLLAPVAAQAEVFDEIVAWVNGDIITKTDYDDEEQLVVAQAYRELTGEELDRYLAEMRSNLLMSMIDRKMLVDQAQRLFDIENMGDIFLNQFREQQGITTDQELADLLKQEGMTVEDIQTRLVEMFAPEEVIRFEVRSRVGVGEKEVKAFYDANQDRFVEAAEVTLSEIVLMAPDDAAKAERKSEAVAIRQRVVDGEVFADVAKQVSEAGTRENGGSLGTMGRSELAEHLAAVAFTLPVGSVSEILETSYGFHILLIDARQDDRVTPFEEVQDRIRDVLMQVKFGEEFDTYMAKVRAQSEWCVKKKYKERLSMNDANSCEGM